jgi:hypothetical protein
MEDIVWKILGFCLVVSALCFTAIGVVVTYKFFSQVM